MNLKFLNIVLLKAACSFGPSQVLATTENPPETSVRVLWYEGATLQNKIHRFNEQQTFVTYTEIAPHLETNPKQLRETWTGVLLAQLLPKQFKVEPESVSVSVVGNNGYATMFLSTEVLESEPIIAFRKDGHAIPLESGGVQVIFPLSSLAKESKFHRASWWAWYVSTVFVGEFPAQIQLQQNEQMKVIDLTKHKNKKVRSMPMRFPIGKRAKGLPHEAKLEFVALTDIEGVSPGSRLEVVNFLGQKNLVESNLEQYLLVFSADDNPISHGFGGPVQLCHVSNTQDCLYYVQQLNAEAGS